jgi:hypothetical protein
MTPKKLAATLRNQKRCHPPATVQGRERIRDAHLRQGFYAKAEQMALRKLGEEPEQFQSLLEGLWKEFAPDGSLQEGLVIRLARAMWLMSRADRIQEGIALRQAHRANTGRENRLHAQMMRLRLTADTLLLLARSVGQECYVTTKADLAMMKDLHQEGVMGDMGDIALALFYQLRIPGTTEEGDSPEEQQRKVLIRIKEIFGLYPHPDPPRSNVTLESAAASGAPQVEACGDTAVALDQPKEQPPPPPENVLRYPSVTPQQWAARERARQLIENVLNHQVEVCEDERKGLLRELLDGPSPYERAAEIAPTERRSLSLRRMQDTYLREVQRVTDLLLRVQGRKAKQG